MKMVGKYINFVWDFGVDCEMWVNWKKTFKIVLFFLLKVAKAKFPCVFSILFVGVNFITTWT